MKIIHSEGMYRIFNDGIESFDQLPARSYRVGFSEQTGFYLTNADDVKNTEKVYGDLNAKADKVFNAYKHSTRSIGVLMSGEKGIGKTMLARILCERANAMGLPVIIISFASNGIAQFLGSITQPAMILFDEFEKMFSRKDGDAGDQPEMLSLLDGLYNSKWLFCFTCNHISQISDYMLGRPGRIHYHFRFQNPAKSEIEAYLKDNIPEEKWDQIVEVVNYSNYARVNYDALRAIAFEFKMGGNFRDFIGDLNIETLYTSCECSTFIEFNDGSVVVGRNCTTDLVDGTDINHWSLGAWDNEIHSVLTRLITASIDEHDIRPNTEDNDGTYCIPADRLWKVNVGATSNRALTDDAKAMVDSGVKRVVLVPSGFTETADVLTRWERRVPVLKKVDVITPDGDRDTITILKTLAKSLVDRGYKTIDPLSQEHGPNFRSRPTAIVSA